MDSSFSEQFIDGVIRWIQALFNDSEGRNTPRVLAACTGFWHIHCAPPDERRVGQPAELACLAGRPSLQAAWEGALWAGGPARAARTENPFIPICRVFDSSFIHRGFRGLKLEPYLWIKSYNPKDLADRTAVC